MNKMPVNEIKHKRKRIQLKFTKPSLTKQEFKNDVDINEIIRKFKATGELPQRPQGVYLDTTQIPDYQSLQDQVVKANEFFMTLPAQLRARFSNDPGQLLDWASDPRNQKEATEMGVLMPNMESQVPEPVKQAPTEKQENLTKPSEK